MSCDEKRVEATLRKKKDSRNVTRANNNTMHGSQQLALNTHEISAHAELKRGQRKNEREKYEGKNREAAKKLHGKHLLGRREVV